MMQVCIIHHYLLASGPSLKLVILCSRIIVIQRHRVLGLFHSFERLAPLTAPYKKERDLVKAMSDLCAVAIPTTADG
jgi:hypothetical protein